MIEMLKKKKKKTAFCLFIIFTIINLKTHKKNPQ